MNYNMKNIQKDGYFDTMIKECKKESWRVRKQMIINELVNWLLVLSVGLLLVYCVYDLLVNTI